MRRRFSQIISRNRRRHRQNCRIISRIRWKNPHQRRKSQSFSRKERMERTLRSQNRWNRCLKRTQRPRMGWRIRTTRPSLIRNWKSQNHHRWSLESQLLPPKRKHRLRLSIFPLLQTLQISLQKTILVQNLQLTRPNHLFRPHLSRPIHRIKSNRPLRFFIRQNRWIQRNRKKRLPTLGRII